MRLLFYIMICFTSISLSACGIKPPYVDPPAGAEHTEFPRTYPSPSTDPQPGLENKSF
ncbi:MAG: hypothetical protein ACRBCK_09410 [Alphaproteobacteria bacterium]